MKNNNNSEFLKILNYLKTLNLCFFKFDSLMKRKFWSFEAEDKGWNFDAEQHKKQMSQEEGEENEASLSLPCRRQK